MVLQTCFIQKMILFSHSVIAGPVLSPCSFHSSWSCAALREGHPASRERPSGSQRVRKSCPLTAPKPSAKNAVDSRVAKVGLPSSRTCVTFAKPWEPSGPAVCKTSVAYLRKQSKLAALFFAQRQKICRQTASVLESRNGPQNGGQVVRTQANQIETE